VIIDPIFGRIFRILLVKPEPTAKSCERKGWSEKVKGENERRAGLHFAFECSSDPLVPPFTRCVADNDGFSIINCLDIEETSRTVAPVRTGNRKAQ
jgi:hypothetical protein